MYSKCAEKQAFLFLNSQTGSSVYIRKSNPTAVISRLTEHTHALDTLLTCTYAHTHTAAWKLNYLSYVHSLFAELSVKLQSKRCIECKKQPRQYILKAKKKQIQHSDTSFLFRDIAVIYQIARLFQFSWPGVDQHYISEIWQRWEGWEKLTTIKPSTWHNRARKKKKTETHMFSKAASWKHRANA